MSEASAEPPVFKIGDRITIIHAGSTFVHLIGKKAKIVDIVRSKASAYIYRFVLDEDKTAHIYNASGNRGHILRYLAPYPNPLRLYDD